MQDFIDKVQKERDKIIKDSVANKRLWVGNTLTSIFDMLKNYAKTLKLHIDGLSFENKPISINLGDYTIDYCEVYGFSDGYIVIYDSNARYLRHGSIKIGYRNIKEMIDVQDYQIDGLNERLKEIDDYKEFIENSLMQQLPKFITITLHDIANLEEGNNEEKTFI